MRALGAVLAILTISALTAMAQVPGVQPGTELGLPEQPGAPAGAGVGEGDRLAIAISSPNYPVTPGDTYELTFTAGGQPTTSVITVQSDYQLNLNIFGQFDTEGMTYTELRRQVEATVREAYPQSLPSFRLISVGLFEVTIRGAIAETTRSTAWGLSRLSSLVQPLFQPYSSTREVIVISQDGSRESYDLFQAISRGALEEDPYVQPGDSVRVLPAGRLVTVRGAVNQPGRYEVLSDETLADAIRYARGFGPEADQTTVRLSRIRNGGVSSEIYDLTDDEVTGPLLRDGDRITVEPRILRQPVVFIEGALEAEAPAPEEAAAAEEEAAEDDAEADYVRISELYRPGLMLSEVLIEIRDRIGQFAELERTSVVRAQTDEVVEVNGTELLYGYGDAEDVRLGPYDTVFIPSRQISVLVTGPVGAPGLYLYVPGKSPEYYIRRAGGYDREISTSGEYVIYGSNGERRTDASDVRPGDRIEVERDNFVYQFNRHTPVILSTLTLVTTVISVLTLINQ